MDGTWETSNRNLRIYAHVGTSSMGSTIKLEAAVSIDIVKFGGQTKRFAYTKCGIKWEELPIADEGISGVVSDTWYNKYSSNSWDYVNGYLRLGRNLGDEANAYPCTVNGNTMVLQIDGKTFTLTRK